MLETVTKRRPVMEISRYKNAALTMMLDYEIHQSIIIYLKDEQVHLIDVDIRYFDGGL